MGKKRKSVDSKQLTNSNIGKESANIARGLVIEEKQKDTKSNSIVSQQPSAPIGGGKKIFGGFRKPSTKKGVFLTALVALFFVSLVGVLYSRYRYNASAENWPLVDASTGLRAKPADVMIREGKLEKPIKVLEVQANYEEASSTLTLSKLTKKNAYPTKSSQSETGWRVELVDGSDQLITESFFSRSEIMVENGYNPESKTDKSGAKNYFDNKFSVNLKWNDAAEKIRIYDSNNKVVIEDMVKNTKSEDNKQNFYSVDGKDIVKKKSSFIESIQLNSTASAVSDNGVFNIAFVSQGYTSTNMTEFDERVATAQKAILNLEPYKSNTSYISFRMHRTTEDFSCTGPTSTSTAMSCAFDKVASSVNSAGIPYDKVMVIKKSSLSGGTAALAEPAIGGWWSIIASAEGYRDRPEIYNNSVVHELGHNMGLRDEYVYVDTATGQPKAGSINNVAYANCLSGSAKSPFTYSGCTYSNWFRSTENSTMRSFPLTPFYNPVSQTVVSNNLKYLIDKTPPTVSISSTGSNTLSTASIPTSSTVSIAAQDNNAIKSVELYVDGILQGKKDVAPYEIAWNPSVSKTIGKGSIAANSPYSVQITGLAGVPKGTGYVTLSATVINPSSNGNLLIFPCDEARPSTSNINYLAAENTSGVVFTKLSSSGSLCLYSNSAINIAVDITGYYPLALDYTSLSPAKRFIDTRTNGDGANPANTVKTIQISGVSGIPAVVDAANINIAVTGAVTAGSLTIYPCGGARPINPNMLYGTVSATSTMTISKLSKSGTICIYNTSTAHVIVDAIGYITTSGKYSSQSDNARVASKKVVAGSVTQISLVGTSGYSNGVKAYQGILTTSSPAESGNLTIYSCDSARSTGSTHNFTASKSKTSVFMTGVDSTGNICVYSVKDVNIAIDTLGYFTGTSSFTSIPSTRIIDTRPGYTTEVSFQSGTRRLIAKAIDTAGLSTTSSPVDLKY